MTTSAYPGPACEAVGLTKSTLLAATGSHITLDLDGSWKIFLSTSIFFFSKASALYSQWLENLP